MKFTNSIWHLLRLLYIAQVYWRGKDQDYDERRNKTRVEIKMRFHLRGTAKFDKISFYRKQDLIFSTFRPF
jgi:hypothetical protein